jgi:hypothetical protein
MNKPGARKTYGLTPRDWESAINSNNITPVPQKILFGSDRIAAKGYLAKWRQNAVQKFLKAWKGFAAAERGTYKGKLRGQDRSYLATHYNNRVKPTFEADPETVVAPATYMKGYTYPEEPQPSIN